MLNHEFTKFIPKGLIKKVFLVKIKFYTSYITNVIKSGYFINFSLIMVGINAASLSLEGIINENYINFMKLALLIFFATEFFLSILLLGLKSNLI